MVVGSAHKETGVALVNGVPSTLDEARLPVTDRGFLFGHAVFETILVLSGRVIGWNDHMARLARGCERVRIRMPDARMLREHVRSAVALNAKNSGALARKVSVRLLLTGGNSTALAVPRNENGELTSANIVIVCKDAPTMPTKLRTKGLALASFAEARSMQLVDVKSTNYLWNMLALEHARAKGADDAIFVTPEGELSECTTANFVWVNANRRVCAMPHKERCLPGTTLQALSRALRKHEHMVNDAALSLNRLDDATACFVLSSVRGLVPVSAIDSHAFDVKKGAELVEYLNGLLDEELELSAQEA
ncbi:MAG: aminotransferase class IV [Silvanigrellales bacterium]|nr:aminotransferase class IV [Silvanigrellales bacterium]